MVCHYIEFGIGMKFRHWKPIVQEDISNFLVEQIELKDAIDSMVA